MGVVGWVLGDGDTGFFVNTLSHREDRIVRTLEQVASNPSGWDSPSNYVGTPLRDLAKYHVVLTRTRDSSLLEQCNWNEALKQLDGEDGKRVVVVRFGHWACGWWEALCVRGSKKKQGQQIVDALKQYPILNEDVFSDKEWEQAQEMWSHLPIKERVELCQKANCSIFAARHEYIPQQDNGYIFEYCVGY